MRPDQLEKVRQERWRQDGRPLLTLDDAEKWLEETPLCLFLPRRAHLPVPAPSFVEAVEGKPDATPGPAAIAQAYELLGRLVASGAAVPLSLFGTPGERPDFLATPEALSFIYSLQTERNPKKPPLTTGAGKVSRLASEVWKLLEREGALTAAELQERLGREITEAATLRALNELWHSLRVVPVPGDTGEGATWELLSARHRKELNAGSTQSQTTALSVLASFYLQSAVVASSEEAETFLSPLASRSRVRDVLHGLAATRQLGTLAMDAQTQYFLEGTLPEFPEEIADEGSRGVAGLEANGPDAAEAIARPLEHTRGPRVRPAPGYEAHKGTRAPRTREGAERESRPGFQKRPGEGRPGRSASGSRSEGTGGRRAQPSAGGFGERSNRPSRPTSGASRNERDAKPFRKSGEAGGRPSFGSRSRPESGGEARSSARPAGNPGSNSGSKFGGRSAERFGGPPAGRFKKEGDRPQRKFSEAPGQGGAEPGREGKPGRSFGQSGRPPQRSGGRPFRKEGARPFRPAGAPPNREGASRPPQRRSFGSTGRPERAAGAEPRQPANRSSGAGDTKGRGYQKGADRPFAKRTPGGGYDRERPRSGSARPSFGGAGKRPEGGPQRPQAGGGRPWQERSERAEGGSRPDRAARPARQDRGDRPAGRDAGERPSRGRFGDRTSRPGRPGAAGGGQPTGRREGTSRPREEGGGRPAARGGAAGRSASPGTGFRRTGGTGKGGSGRSGPARGGPGKFGPAKKGSGGFRPPRRSSAPPRRRPDEGGAGE